MCPPGQRVETEGLVGAVLLQTDRAWGCSRVPAVRQTRVPAPRRHCSGQNTQTHSLQNTVCKIKHTMQETLFFKKLSCCNKVCQTVITNMIHIKGLFGYLWCFLCHLSCFGVNHNIISKFSARSRAYFYYRAKPHSSDIEQTRSNRGEEWFPLNRKLGLFGPHSINKRRGKGLKEGLLIVIYYSGSNHTKYYYSQ